MGLETLRMVKNVLIRQLVVIGKYRNSHLLSYSDHTWHVDTLYRRVENTRHERKLTSLDYSIGQITLEQEETGAAIKMNLLPKYLRLQTDRAS